MLDLLGVKNEKYEVIPVQGWIVSLASKEDIDSIL